MTNKLEKIFGRQKELQKLLRTDTQTQPYLNHMVLSTHIELSEMLQQTKWNWRKPLNEENAKKEFIDVFTFVVNIAIALKIDPEELYQRYIAKNDKNIMRANEMLRKNKTVLP